MSELYGAPSGIRAAEQDMRENARAALGLQTGEVELQKAKMELGQQQQMMQLMSGLVGGGGLPGGPGANSTQAQDLPDTMDLLSTMAIKSGMPEKAKEYALAGSTLRHNTALVDKAKADYNVKNLNTLSSLLQDVHDEQGWHQANAAFTMATQTESPYARLPYDPAMVEKLKEGITTAKDRALTEAAKAREKSSESERAERLARVPLIKAQTEVALERAEKLRKAGAQGSIVKSADLKLITDQADKDFPGQQASELRVISQPIAERMLDLIDNQKLSRVEAATKAYSEAKERGDFAAMRPARIRPGSADKPREMPLGKDGKIDQSAMKPNMWYHGTGKYAGQNLFYTGKGFNTTGPKDEEDGEDGSDDETDE